VWVGTAHETKTYRPRSGNLLDKYAGSSKPTETRIRLLSLSHGNMGGGSLLGGGGGSLRTSLVLPFMLGHPGPRRFRRIVSLMSCVHVVVSMAPSAHILAAKFLEEGSILVAAHMAC